MNIPDEIVAAADIAYWKSYIAEDDVWDGHVAGVRAALEAAAPHFTPRIITTAKEVAALKPGTVVLDDYGVACQLELEWLTEAGPSRTWMTTGCDANASVALPAKVLYEPEESK